MWLKCAPAFLVLWGLWTSTPTAGASLPPNKSMAQMTQLFQDFVLQFKKTYQSQEEMIHRFKIFMQNLESSRELQALELGTAQYGVTQFSDITESEFVKKFGMTPLSLTHLPPIRRSSVKNWKRKNLKSCDWRKAGAVTAVKHQGDCRSCWAFSAVSNIEALWNIHRHVARNVSVQEMVDCTYNGKGCEGGYPWDGFQTAINRSGLSNSLLYPYVGKDQRCQKYRRRQTITRIDGYEVLPRDEQCIAEVVISRGPVTALINVKLLQNYQNGIIHIRDPQACSVKCLDHVVAIVGFGRGSQDGPYWIVQNSWGEHWGEKGYFRLHRGINMCGIAEYAATAVVRNSGQKKPLACPP